MSARSSRFQANFNIWFTIVLGIVILLMVNHLGVRYYWRKDCSFNNYYQLSPKTLGILKMLPGEVRITTFLLNTELNEKVKFLLEEYQRSGKGKIKVDLIDPAIDVTRAEAVATKYKLQRDENVVIFEYKDRHKIVGETQLYEPDYSRMGQRKVAAFKGEGEFTATIQALVEGNAAKIYYITGHGEPDLADSGARGYSLIAARVDTENIKLEPLNLAVKGEIPSDADAVMIAGPKTALSPVEIEPLQNYLSNKGKMLLMQDPGMHSGLEPLIAKYGLRFDDDIIVMRSIAMLGDRLGMGNFELAVTMTYSNHPIVRFLKGYNLQLRRTCSVSMVPNIEEGVKSKITELAKTGPSPDCWGATNLTDVKKGYDPNVDLRAPLCVASLYDAGNVKGDDVNVMGTRILVIGTSTFLLNGARNNLCEDFIAGALNWMVKKDVSLGIAPKMHQEYNLNLSPLQQRSVLLMSCMVMPLLAFIMGFCVWYRRRS